MDIDIQYIRISSSESLNQFVIKKLMKIAKKYAWLIKGQVTFSFENKQKRTGNTCEILLSLPGPRIFAKSTETNFEKAAAQTVSDLEIQLKKRKQQFQDY